MKRNMAARKADNGYDVLILGAGASGLVCARECAARGRRVLVLDHADAPGNKIRISGGGKCNFTNTTASARDYVCANPHFVKSALSQYTPHDFLEWMRRQGLPVHDMGWGMLFSHSARDVAEALHRDAEAMGAAFAFNTAIKAAKREGDAFRVDTDRGAWFGSSLVLALGGPSWPQVGATDLGYRLAKQFGLRCLKTSPGLVPLLAGADLAPLCRELSGVSLPVRIAPPYEVEGSMLFTHRGVSGPAILNASLFWKQGRPLSLDLLPGVDVPRALEQSPSMTVKNALSALLPKRLAAWLCDKGGWEGQVANLSKKRLAAMEATLHGFAFTPRATAGFAKAEVTLGGLDTDRFSSKTMEARQVPGLHCVGELLDVTGKLGGYNLQWAWSSGYVAGQWA